MSDTPILPTSPTADTPATTPPSPMNSSTANAKSLDDVLASLEKEVNQLTAEKAAKPATESPASQSWNATPAVTTAPKTTEPVMPSEAKPVSIPPMMPMGSAAGSSAKPAPSIAPASTFSESVTEHPVGDTKPVSNPMSAPKPAFADKKPVNTAAMIAESQHTAPTPTAPASNNKPSKSWKINGKIVAGLVGLVILLVGTLVTLRLLPQNQDIRQQAAFGDQCWEKHEIECRGDSQCVWKPAPVGQTHQCAFEGANCNHQNQTTQGCFYTEGRNRGCTGPGNCPSKLSADGCRDSGLCTWTETAVTSTCTGTWSETQYGAGSCEPGTPPATNPPTNPPATNPPTNPPATAAPTATPNSSVNNCHYVKSGNTVSVAGNCSGITFRVYKFECNGANGDKCEPGQSGYGTTLSDSTVQGNTSGGASISIGSIPCGKRQQVDITIIDRPDNHNCGGSSRGDGVACDTLPGSDPNFIIQAGNATCGSTPTPTPTPVPVGPSCTLLANAPAGSVNEKAFLVQTSGTVSNVDLYYMKQGTTNKVKITTDTTSPYNFVWPISGLANGTYEVYADVTGQGQTCTGSSIPGTGSSCPACRTTVTIGSTTQTPPSCTNLTSSAATAPKIGDKLVFTCTGQNANGYNFRYSSDNGVTFTALTDNDSGKSNELTISKAGKYVVQCQACKDGKDCTNWLPVK